MSLDFLAGYLGGMVGVLIGHPLDTIKVHLQVKNPNNPHYKGIITTVVHLLKKEGPLSLFRGMSSPLIGLSLMNAVLFGIYGNVMGMFEAPESMTAQCTAGGASAVGTAVVSSPMELIKSRMQVAGARAGKNPIDALMILYREEGLIKGVFKGLGITVFREVPSNISYFVSFEHLSSVPNDQNTPPIDPKNQKPLSKETNNKQDAPSSAPNCQEASMLQLFNAGGVAGVVSWVVPYPADVIKSKIQVDGAKGETKKYKNWYDCLRKTIKNEGYTGLYRGLIPTVIRAYPTNGVTFVCVTLLLRHWKVDQKGSRRRFVPPPMVKTTGNTEADIGKFGNRKTDVHERDYNKAEQFRRTHWNVSKI